MKPIFITLCLLLSLSGFSQDYEVKVHVSNLPEGSTPQLTKIFNGDIYIVDSLPSNIGDSLFTFKVSKNTNPGLLRIILGSTVYARYSGGQPATVDILFNNENTDLSVDFNEPIKSIQIASSKENKLYFDFLRQDEQYFRKLGILEQTVTQYPDKDDFYNLALKYYEIYQKERSEFIDNLCKANSKTFASRIIRTRQMPFTKGDATPAMRDSIFKAKFFDFIDFQDSTLLFTNIYTDKVFQYLNFFIDRNAGQRENEENIIRALEDIMPRISGNEEIRNALLQFMINGFDAMKMEEVLAHISANYMQQCGSSMDIVKRRLEAYQKMAVGNKVPDLLAMDIDNNPVSLYGSVNPYTLLIFWHTGCGHCKQLMADLKPLMEKDFFKKHNINILGVSIDDNREDWVAFSKANPMPWTNTFVEGAFGSQVAADYNLFATPSILLLDSDNTIIGKPLTIEDLRESIDKL